MAKYKKQAVSEKSQQEAEAITKGTKKPGQTKEQSKLIAQGIAKGIEQYKKQQKAKAREKDKELKKQAKLEQQNSPSTDDKDTIARPSNMMTWLPWGLLIISWIGFAVFYSQNL